MLKKIEETFAGKIWNTVFYEDKMVLEVRDESSRQVSFSALNLKTGEVLWKDYHPEKSWWLGLVGIFGNHLVLHKYSDQQKPEPLGVILINITTCEIEQRIEDWIFFSCDGNILVLYQLDESNLPIYQSLEIGLKPFQSFIPEQNQHFVRHYPDSSPHFPTIFKFLYHLINIEAQNGVDYLEVNDKIVISYYIYRGKQFQNYLLVTNKEKKILLHDFIAESEGIGIDTFSMKSDTLLYVKNQNQLIGYEI
ncbi:hypothetical protein ABID42_002544 [Arcicella rosea]|uniref:DUF4905 domain-containing protein n=1 Tax=Arcicella rosea TaxID=502909 RepID=UPI00345D909B